MFRGNISQARIFMIFSSSKSVVCRGIFYKHFPNKGVNMEETTLFSVSEFSLSSQQLLILRAKRDSPA